MAVRAPRGKARSTRRKARLEAAPVMLPTLVRNIPLYEVLDEEGEELIHDASMKILEEVGIEFRDDEGIEYWKAAGAEVDGYRVRIQREMLLGLVEQCPEEFTLHGRNPDRTVKVGGKNMIFAPTYGSPFVLDFDNKRRYSTLDDLNKFHPAGPDGPESACQRGGYLRADRYRGIQTSSAHRLQRAPPFGQTIHGSDHRARASRRHDRDDQDRHG